MINLAKNSTRVLGFNKMLTRSQIVKFSADSLKVNHDPKKRQFYAEMDNKLATIDYDMSGKKIVLLHTEVPEIFRSKGVGKILAEEAFKYAAKNNLSVKINCDYLQHYFKTNKDKFNSLKIVSD